MPLNKEIKKVLVIGSGPIIIGQAAEFDYAGTQACQALKQDGLEVVLVNSNPATIMTDKNIADKVYIEPLTKEILKKIIEKEAPDSILPTLGGQTGLNLAMELSEDGILDEKGINLLGTKIRSIKMAEDRQEFKDLMQRIEEPVIHSKVVDNLEDAVTFVEEIELPAIIRPAYTMGGTGGGIAYTMEEFVEIAGNGIRLSRVGEILVEKNIEGWKEIEYEVMRDAKGNAITVCNMENFDPVGIHTGDSIVVAPSQTLSDKEYQMLRTSALKIISELGIEGGCNVQYALHPDSFEYAVIEVNPRVSRSSALASKATGYPIAKVATKIAIGYGLDEIKNEVTQKTYACFEPTLDYVVVKIPKWPFDKFVKASRKLGTQMKATGEVMAISNTFEAALLKAIQSLELGVDSLQPGYLAELTMQEIEEKIKQKDDERIFTLAEALRRGMSVEKIFSSTKIDRWFLNRLGNIVQMEKELAVSNKVEPSSELLLMAKKMGFADSAIGRCMGLAPAKVKQIRKAYGIHPVYKMVDTCAAEFEAQTPYYYSTFDEHTELRVSDKKKVLVIGSGPIRIGQGIEFDYCSVHSVWALKDAGYETIIINNNPETVSTDFDTSDKLFFEPLTEEYIEYLVDAEKPDGAIVQFGGQTAINLAGKLEGLGVKILGTPFESLDRAEDREKFDVVLSNCMVPRPEGTTVLTKEEAVDVASRIGYPVLVRPSYVLGGKGMEIAFNDADLVEFMDIINREVQEHPILIDKYLMGKELEVDAICDGTDILIPGIMQHLERAGVHSGDSIAVYPPQTIDEKHLETMVLYTERLAKELQIIGIVNIQFVLHGDELFVIEVNPRSSRTVPYLSKVTGVPMVELATKCCLGQKLQDMGFGIGLYPEKDIVAVKVPVFSFEKLHDLDTSLGPEMKSTGEVLGIAKTFSEAVHKGFLGCYINIPAKGNILLTVADGHKQELVPLAAKLLKMGFKLYATEKTCQSLIENQIKVELVKKIGNGQPNLMTMLDGGELDLVIITPTKGREAKRDGFKIRRKAVEKSVPCLTSLDTAWALVKSIDHHHGNGQVDVVELGSI